MRTVDPGGVRGGYEGLGGVKGIETSPDIKEEVEIKPSLEKIPKPNFSYYFLGSVITCAVTRAPLCNE